MCCDSIILKLLRSPENLAWGKPAVNILVERLLKAHHLWEKGPQGLVGLTGDEQEFRRQGMIVSQDAFNELYGNTASAMVHLFSYLMINRVSGWDKLASWTTREHILAAENVVSRGFESIEQLRDEISPWLLNPNEGRRFAEWHECVTSDLPVSFETNVQEISRSLFDNKTTPLPVGSQEQIELFVFSFMNLFFVPPDRPGAFYYHYCNACTAACLLASTVYRILGADPCGFEVPRNS